MTKNKGLWSAVGFVLVTLGVTALVMQMVGVRWVFLAPLEWGGPLIAFVSKLLMAIAGIVVFVLARTDWDLERRESSN